MHMLSMLNLRITHYFDKIVALVLACLWLVFVLMWTLGGIVAMVYWLVKDETLNAVLSIMIPVYGLASMIVDLLR